MEDFVPTKSVDDIRVIDVRGPWNSKSGGLLEVHFMLTDEEVDALRDRGNPEFAAVEEATGGVNIRGLRCYTVSKIPKGSIGAQEWHRARTEMVRAVTGKALWVCTDPFGGKREIELDGTKLVMTPPGILHEYRALEDDTTLEVICNTQFIPDDPRTHDSNDQASFHELQARAARPQ